MIAEILTSRHVALLTFSACIAYVHLRGRERLGLLRQVVDHSAIMAPYNTLMYLFSAVRAEPYADVRQFPELAILADNWQTIRDEAVRLCDAGHIRAAAKHNDLAFKSFFRRGWKRFYLKWYAGFLPSAAALCPRTVALLAGIPSVNAAMFALLPPASYLGRHRDPFAGSLRYHLGLTTPNSERCLIVVDGQPYFWKDGEAVMFDETFVHYVENQTDHTRLILLCDIERPLSNFLVRAINRYIGRSMIRSAAAQNVEGEHVGALNKLGYFVHQIELNSKRFKAWHRPSYYVTKWSLIAALAYGIFH